MHNRGHTSAETFGASSCFRQLGQYQEAGILTGFGLLLRHLAQRKRLPLTAVFGRTFFPVLRMLFDIGTSAPIISSQLLAPGQGFRGTRNPVRPPARAVSAP